MSKIIRLFLLAAFVGGVIAAIGHFYGEATNGTAAPLTQPTVVPVPPASDPSQVVRSTDSTGTLLSFNLISGDALVIRLSENGMSSCTFKIHAGPLAGGEHAAAGVAVDFQIVAVASWRATVEQLSQACGQYWQIID